MLRGFPELEPADGDHWKVTGSLTLRGTTRPVVLDVQRSTADGSRASAHASTTIDRRDFGITYSGYAVGKHGDLLAVVARGAPTHLAPSAGTIRRSTNLPTCRQAADPSASSFGTGNRTETRFSV
jgi:YceI-like protein